MKGKAVQTDRKRFASLSFFFSLSRLCFSTALRRLIKSSIAARRRPSCLVHIKEQHHGLTVSFHSQLGDDNDDNEGGKQKERERERLVVSFRCHQLSFFTVSYSHTPTRTATTTTTERRRRHHLIHMHSSQSSLPLPSHHTVGAGAAPTPRTPFQSMHPFEARCLEARKLRMRYPGHVPVIFEPATYTTSGPSSLSTTAAAPATTATSSTSTPATAEAVSDSGNSGAGGVSVDRLRRWLRSDVSAENQAQRTGAEHDASSTAPSHGGLSGEQRDDGQPGPAPSLPTGSAKNETLRDANAHAPTPASTSASPPLPPPPLTSPPTTSHWAAPQYPSSAAAAMGSPSPPPPPPPRASHAGVFRFVMPESKTLSEVILSLRQRLAVSDYQAVFLTVGDADLLAPGNSLLGDLYERHRDADGLLYISYSLENTFGGGGGGACACACVCVCLHTHFAGGGKSLE